MAGNFHKNLVEIKRVVPEIFWLRYRQRYTDILITILAHTLRGFTRR